MKCEYIISKGKGPNADHDLPCGLKAKYETPEGMHLCTTHWKAIQKLQESKGDPMNQDDDEGTARAAGAAENVIEAPPAAAPAQEQPEETIAPAVETKEAAAETIAPPAETSPPVVAPTLSPLQAAELQERAASAMPPLGLRCVQCGAPAPRSATFGPACDAHFEALNQP